MLAKMGIEDKGKSGWIAEYLVLLQTSWFVKQCIAWGIEHLPVTGTNHSTSISLFECSGNLSRGPEDVEQISKCAGTGVESNPQRLGNIYCRFSGYGCQPKSRRECSGFIVPTVMIS